MRRLDDVTLLCVDGLDPERARVAMDKCEALMSFGDVRLLSAIRYPGAITVRAILSLNEYSKFMLFEAHQHVSTSHALVVQHDGWILNADAWDDEFLKYDYVGAPWLSGRVGNGGFSLRSKKLMEAVSRLVPPSGNLGGVVNEDAVICVGLRDRLESAGFKFAPLDVATRFSVEQADCDYGRVFGFHGFRTLERWRASTGGVG